MPDPAMAAGKRLPTAATLSTEVVPTSTLAGRVTVEGTEGSTWEDLTPSTAAGLQSLAAIAETTLVTVATRWASLTGSTRTGV